MEGLRDSLLGMYDIHMGRAAQQANDVMKALTVLSAVLLPAVVLAGIMGMNFQVGFFEDPDDFWLVLLGMGVSAVGILAFAAGGAGSDGQPSVMTRRANPNSAPPAGRPRAQIRPPIAATRRAHTKSPIPAPVADLAVLGAR